MASANYRCGEGFDLKEKRKCRNVSNCSHKLERKCIFDPKKLKQRCSQCADSFIKCLLCNRLYSRRIKEMKEKLLTTQKQPSHKSSKGVYQCPCCGKESQLKRHVKEKTLPCSSGQSTRKTAIKSTARHPQRRQQKRKSQTKPVLRRSTRQTTATLKKYTDAKTEADKEKFARCVSKCRTRTVELPSTQNVGREENKLLFMLALGLIPKFEGQKVESNLTVKLIQTDARYIAEIAGWKAGNDSKRSNHASMLTKGGCQGVPTGVLTPPDSPPEC